MGQIHNQITRGPWTNALKAALGITKSDGGIERFGETMQPVVDLWSRPDWLYLLEVGLWSASESQAAVPAEFSAIAVTNPPTSGNIIVVQVANARIGVANTVAMGLALRTTIAGTLTVSNPGDYRDTRFQKNPLLSVFNAPVETWVGSDTVSIDTVQEQQAAVAAAEVVDFKSPPYVLKPGTGLFIQNQTLNTLLAVNFAGYVRKAFTGELG